MGVYLVIGLLSVFCVIPFIWVMLASVDEAAGLYLKMPALTADNFLRFFKDATTPRLLVNSLLISGGATVLTLVLAMFGGYALSRFSFFGRRTLMFTILLVRVVPTTATIVPLYLMMIRLHLNNSYVGLILVETAYQLPLILWLMKGSSTRSRRARAGFVDRRLLQAGRRGPDRLPALETRTGRRCFVHLHQRLG